MKFDFKGILITAVLFGVLIVSLGWVIYKASYWMITGGEKTIETSYPLEPEIKVNTVDGVSDTTYIYKITK